MEIRYLVASRLSCHELYVGVFLGGFRVPLLGLRVIVLAFIGLGLERVWSCKSYKKIKTILYVKNDRMFFVNIWYQ